MKETNKKYIILDHRADREDISEKVALNWDFQGEDPGRQ